MTSETFTFKEVVFRREGVLTRSKKTEHVLIGGTLIVALADQVEGAVVQWRPDEEPYSHLGIEVEICELKSFRLSEDGNQVTLIQRDGTNSPTLIFLDDGPQGFINKLEDYASVKQSNYDNQLYLLRDLSVVELDESLLHLNLFDGNGLGGGLNGGGRGHSTLWKFVSDAQRDPYTAALSAFSKVAEKLVFSPVDDDRPEEDVAELLHRSFVTPSTLDVTTSNTEDGEEFEVVTARPRVLDDLPVVTRSETALSRGEWESFFDDDGRMNYETGFREAVFGKGVEHDIRAEVWKFLLGYFDASLTHDERAKIRSERAEEYFRMKIQWETISEEQERRFSAFRERKNQIEKDVLRTDRSHPFYEGADNPNLQTLTSVLMTYVMYNFDLGYVQGMSDLLSPILFVMQNEVDAFWCFAKFMERVKSNFDLDQGGMKRQLGKLIELHKCVDPGFYSYLATKESGNFYFCFRWLLIWFKREFSFGDTIRLWEVLWTRLPCDNFHLVLCVALIQMEKATIMENGFGLTEILKHVNDMSSNIDVDRVLSDAESIFLRLEKLDFCGCEPVKKILSVAGDGEESAEGDGESESSIETIEFFKIFDII